MTQRPGKGNLQVNLGDIELEICYLLGADFVLLLGDQGGVSLVHPRIEVLVRGVAYLLRRTRGRQVRGTVKDFKLT